VTYLFFFTGAFFVFSAGALSIFLAGAFIFIFFSLAISILQFLR